MRTFQQSSPPNEESHKVYYAKTLRLTSDQLVSSAYQSTCVCRFTDNTFLQKQLQLNDGANTITFSVTSSYSGQASCTARIFLWDESDQVVISDIDGTITKCVILAMPMRNDRALLIFSCVQIGRSWSRFRGNWPRLDSFRCSQALHRHHQQRL
jgi:hypothetical protein